MVPLRGRIYSRRPPSIRSASVDNSGANHIFQSWLAGLDRLSAEQWSQLQQAVQERSEGAAAVAAIELQIETERRCPHHPAGRAVCRGTTRGSRRHSCKRCCKSFDALSGTALSGLHHKERWLALGRSLVEPESVRRSAQRCGLAVTAAFRWRHRFLQQAGRLEGLVEADETYLLHGQKGERKLPRKARRWAKCWRA